MGERKFTFRQFTIIQDHAAMQVGTDSILLGSWVTVDQSSSGKLVDVGTGTGLLALMMAQRYPQLRIDAIELDTAAIKDARVNIRDSPWSDRVRLHEIDARLFGRDPVYAGHYDHVISNPPFFQQGLSAKDMSRTRARQQVDLSVANFWELVAHVLGSDGQAHLILPWQDWEIWKEEAKTIGFYPRRICHVRARPQKMITRVLGTFSRIDKKAEQTDRCIREERGDQYSEFYRTLTDTFYLPHVDQHKE